MVRFLLILTGKHCEQSEQEIYGGLNRVLFSYWPPTYILLKIYTLMNMVKVQAKNVEWSYLDVGLEYN